MNSNRAELALDEEGPSKSQLKRDAEALQNLGVRMSQLKPKQLVSLELDDVLVKAIEDYIKLPNSYAARKRHAQYIGKLMRSADSERIAQSLDALHEGSRKEKAREHMIEAARSALISRGDDALQEVLAIWPNADRQMLRQLSRSAIDEQKKALPPTSARKLFRYLRSLPESDSED